MIEKRVVSRHRVLKHGTLAFDGGGAVDCMVRNVSSNGARLDVASPIGVPEDFTLVIGVDHFKRHCRAIWGHDKRLGVAFD